ISETEIPDLRQWDVCVAQGKGESAIGVTVVGPNGEELAVAKRQRQFEKSRSKDVPYLKINKQRVGDISDEMVDLAKADISRAEENWRSLDPVERAKKRVPGEAYRYVRKRPLLTIHLIEPTDAAEDSKNASRIMPAADIRTDLLVAISL